MSENTKPTDAADLTTCLNDGTVYDASVIDKCPTCVHMEALERAKKKRNRNIRRSQL